MIITVLAPHGCGGTVKPAAGGAGAAASMRRVDLLLGDCALPELRQRRSHKWRAYPPDVLPAFVAEMDFSLAEPVIAAVTSALGTGDCG